MLFAWQLWEFIFNYRPSCTSCRIMHDMYNCCTNTWQCHTRNMHQKNLTIKISPKSAWGSCVKSKSQYLCGRWSYFVEDSKPWAAEFLTKQWIHISTDNHKFQRGLLSSSKLCKQTMATMLCQLYALFFNKTTIWSTPYISWFVEDKVWRRCRDLALCVNQYSKSSKNEPLSLPISSHFLHKI